MLPVGESVSNVWRRKVLFLRGVGGARGRRADVEHRPKQHEQEYDKMDVHQLEE